jgi:predicted RNase H-like HicB family nuclease
VLCMVPGIEGRQSQGKTVEETLANIREAIELFLETLSDGEVHALDSLSPMSIH